MIDVTVFVWFRTILRGQNYLPNLPIILGLLLAVTYLHHVSPRRNQILSLPTLGKRADNDFRAALEEGYRRYPDKAFALPTVPSIVILPHELINQLKSAPESQLSADKEVCRRGLGQYTDLGIPMPDMFNAIKVDLTRRVRDLVPVLQDEVAYAFKKNLGQAHGEEWEEVTAFVLVKRIVTVMNAVGFVGKRLSRNDEWQEIAYNYSTDLRRAFDALNKWHPWLRPIVHPFLFYFIGFSARRHRVATMLQPLLDDDDDFICADESRNVTLLKLIQRRLGRKHRDDGKLMARMQLRAALAGSDTVAQAVTNAIFDIASTQGLADSLREEVASLLSKCPDGRWDMSMLRSMSRLDSLLRESGRVYAPFLGEDPVFRNQQLLTAATTVAMGRVTTSPLALDDGTVVPKDTTVYFDMYNAHKSRKVQNSKDLGAFDGLRFSNKRDEEGLPNKYLAATTGPDNLPFGHGAHSCPGRFFAVAVMKVILAHLLLNYDIRLLGERPGPSYAGIAVMMDRNAKIVIRRRHDSLP